MKIPFKYFLHGSKESWAEEIDDLLERAGFVGDSREDALDSACAQFPFYEIAFDCELDTETGKVELKIRSET